MAARATLNPPVLSGYTYVRPLGSGGFADVFLFQQNMPLRLVAVKVLLSKVSDPQAARALASEADIMASLSSHPSILTVYEASVSADGRPYMVMEYCPTSFTNRYRSEVMPVPEVLTVGVKVSSAVESAHRRGLLHRDIKPSNILVTAFGQPVLSDFGVAAVVASADDDTIAMSPPWSAPEVVEKRSAGTIHTEVWALAATIYTLLAGRSPFDLGGARRNDSDLKARISRAKYPPIGRPDVPAALEAVLERGMRRLPADRYPSALAFAQALQEVERGLGLPVTGLEVPSEEWAQAALPELDGQTARGPIRSTVPVESSRQRRGDQSSSRMGTATRREQHAHSVGKRAVIALGVVGGALLAALLGAAAVTWWGA